MLREAVKAAEASGQLSAIAFEMAGRRPAKPIPACRHDDTGGSEIGSQAAGYLKTLAEKYEQFVAVTAVLLEEPDSEQAAAVVSLGSPPPPPPPPSASGGSAGCGSWRTGWRQGRSSPHESPRSIGISG